MFCFLLEDTDVLKIRTFLKNYAVIKQFNLYITGTYFCSDSEGDICL